MEAEWLQNIAEKYDIDFILMEAHLKKLVVNSMGGYNEYNLP